MTILVAAERGAEASRRLSQNTTLYGLLKETFVEELAKRGTGTALCPWVTLKLVRGVLDGGRSKTQSVVE